MTGYLSGCVSKRRRSHHVASFPGTNHDLDGRLNWIEAVALLSVAGADGRTGAEFSAERTPSRTCIGLRVCHSRISVEERVLACSLESSALISG